MKTKSIFIALFACFDESMDLYRRYCYFLSLRWFFP